MNETAYTNKVRKLLNVRGCYSEKIWGGGMQSAGIPDILVCYRGIFIGLELKVKNNKPSPLQEAKVKLIRDSGGIAGVFWDRLEPIEYILNSIDKIFNEDTINISTISVEDRIRSLNVFNIKADSYNEEICDV